MSLADQTGTRTANLAAVKAHRRAIFKSEINSDPPSLVCSSRSRFKNPALHYVDTNPDENTNVTYHDPPVDSTCTHDGDMCFLGFRSRSQQKRDSHVYTDVLTDRQADLVIKELVKSARDDRDWLKTVLADNGDRVLHAWAELKRKHDTPELFAEIMEKYFKNIKVLQDVPVGSSFPQLDCLLRLGVSWSKKRREKGAQAAFLLPYMNASNLVNGERDIAPHELGKLSRASRFLQMLYHRAEFPIEDFASLDLQQSELGWRTGLLGVKFSTQCYSLCGGDYVYGGHCEYDKEKMHRGEMIGYPRASLLFETQRILYASLKSILMQLMPNYKHTDKKQGKDQWQARVRKGFATSGAKLLPFSEIDSFFGGPPRFAKNLSTAAEELSEMERDTEQALSELQTHPEITRGYIEERLATDHLKHQDEGTKWLLLVDRLFKPKYTNAVELRDLRRIALNVCAMAKKYEDIKLGPGDRPHEDYVDSIVELADAVESSMRRHRSRKWGLPADLQYESNAPRYPDQPEDDNLAPCFKGRDSEDDIERWTKLCVHYFSKESEHELWLVVTFLTSKLLPDWLRLGLLITYCTESLRGNDEASSLDSDTLSTLQIVAMLLKLKSVQSMHRPFVRQGVRVATIPAREGDLEKSEEAQPERWAKERHPHWTFDPSWYNSDDSEDEWGLHRQQERAKLLEDFWRTGWPKSLSDKEWLQLVLASRGNLGRFWDSVRSAKIPNIWEGEPPLEDVPRLYSDLETRMLLGDQTTAHQEALQKEVVFASTSKRKRSVDDDPSSSSGSKRGKRSQKNQNNKTNSAANEGRGQATFKIPVSQKSLDAFAIVWDNPGQGKHSKELPWESLKKAMKEAGIKMPNKPTGGSTVRCKREADPGRWNANTIVLHQPHDRVIPSHYLWDIRKYLEGGFGWCLDTFELGKAVEVEKDV